MPVNKSARNRSADPAQEHLRQRKQDWNSACSEFIARLNGFKPHLISFKRGLNGRGDAKAGLPISDIKNPLPAEIGGYLGAVSSEFNELASVFSQLVGEAGGIMQEQSQYAHRRRQPHKRHASAMQVDDGLSIAASSSLSRFWANVAALWSSDPLKAERLSMLKMAHELFESFVDFEDEVLVKGVANVHEVLTQYFLVSNKLNALNLSLQKIRTAKERQEALLSRPKPVKPNSDDANPTSNVGPTTPTDKPVSIPPKPEDVDYASAPIEKLRELAVFMVHHLGLGLTIEDIRPFLEVCTSVKLERNPQMKEQREDRARDLFKEFFSAIKDRFAEKFNVKVSPEATLGDLYDLRYKKASSFEDELTKYSGNALSRLIKKIKHQFGGKDASSASRMEIYTYIREAKVLTDQLMDLLEKKHLDLDTAMEKVSKLDELIIKIAEPLKILNVLYKDKFYENKKKKKVDPTLDPAGRYFTKQVRRDVDKPGW